MTSAATVIVTALATGAATGAGEQAIKDAYAGLKELLVSRFSVVNVEPLEQKPASKPKQESLAEDLAEAGADRDQEVLKASQELIKLVESRAPEAAIAAGITIEQLRAGGSVNIKELIAPGDINITGVVAGAIPLPSGGKSPNS